MTMHSTFSFGRRRRMSSLPGQRVDAPRVKAPKTLEIETLKASVGGVRNGRDACLPLQSAAD